MMSWDGENTGGIAALKVNICFIKITKKKNKKPYYIVRHADMKGHVPDWATRVVLKNELLVETSRNDLEDNQNRQ